MPSWCFSFCLSPHHNKNFVKSHFPACSGAWLRDLEAITEPTPAQSESQASGIKTRMAEMCTENQHGLQN